MIEWQYKTVLHLHSLFFLLPNSPEHLSSLFFFFSFYIQLWVKKRVSLNSYLPMSKNKTWSHVVIRATKLKSKCVWVTGSNKWCNAMQLTNGWSCDKAQVVFRYQPSVKPGKRNKITDATNHNQHGRHEQPPPNLALKKRFRGAVNHRTQPRKVQKPVPEHQRFQLQGSRAVSTRRRRRNNRFPPIAACRRNNFLINACIITSEPVGEANGESPVQLRKQRPVRCVECRICEKGNPSSNSVDTFYVSSFCIINVQ